MNNLITSQKIILPLPEICDQNSSNSFRQKTRDHLYHKLTKKPPRLHLKHEMSFNRSLNHSAAHAISFKVDSKTPNVLPLSPIYNKNANEPYYDQCFQEINKIGEGSFGEVFKVKSKEDGQFYAVKKSKQFFRSSKNRQERLEEVKRYEEFSEHEHCVTLHKAWEQDDHLYMQMELCKENLETYALNNILTEPEIWSILLDLLLALKSLHDRNLIHLDIKLDNILITNEKICKLADFGLMVDLNRENLDQATEGDSRYIAPELMGGHFTKAADIFSLGIAILELSCNLELPPNGLLWQKLRTDIFPDEFFQLLSIDLQNIIKWMMASDPKNRPTVDTLLQHPRILAIIKKRNQYRIYYKSKKFYKLTINWLWRKISYIKLKIINLFTTIITVLTLKHRKNNNNNKSNCSNNINNNNLCNNDKLLMGTTGGPSSYLLDKTINNIDNDITRLSLITTNSIGNNYGIDEEDDDEEYDYLQIPINKVANSTPNITRTPLLKIINSTPLNHWGGYGSGVGGSSYTRKYRKDLCRSQLGFNSCDSNLFEADTPRRYETNFHQYSPTSEPHNYSNKNLNNNINNNNTQLETSTLICKKLLFNQEDDSE